MLEQCLAVQPYDHYQHINNIKHIVTQPVVITIDADKSLKHTRYAMLLLPEMNEMFQALLYDNDGQICVIQGPITQPRQVDNKRIHHTAHNFVIPT